MHAKGGRLTCCSRYHNVGLGGHVADTSIAPGDRVRVTTPTMELAKGGNTVAALETDTLVVKTEESADALGVPLANVTKLELGARRSSPDSSRQLRRPSSSMRSFGVEPIMPRYVGVQPLQARRPAGPGVAR